MASYINIDGNIVSANDGRVYSNSAFRYGVGLFETILVLRGEIQLWQYHQSRLLDGMHVLSLTLPGAWMEKSIEDHILEIVKTNGSSSNYRVRLQIFTDGGIYNQAGDTRFIIECSEIGASVLSFNETGLKLGYATDVIKSVDSLANLKTTSALHYWMAARRARTNGWDDAIILNQFGNVIETSIANIFWVKSGAIYTPPLSEGCIAGTMRRYLLDQLPHAGFKVVEQPLTKEILKSADAAFLTNAIRRIKWIRSIGDTEYDTGIISSIVQELFD